MTGQDLKNSILQLAIQGKLVPQDANDEPASVLLERIKAEKQKLIKEKKIKKEKPLPEITEEEKPFEIPETWEWVRLANVGITNTGTTPSKSNPNFFGDYIPFLGPGDIQNSTITYGKIGLSELGYEVARPVPANTIIQVCIGGSIGKCAIVDRESTFNQQINSLTTLICNHKYLFYCMQSDFFAKKMIDNSTGTATPIINRGLWDLLLIPLPPLSEQHRIVAKIEELMPLVEEYDKAQKELDALNAKLPEALKKSILQEAIQGKLVTQDHNDEPASVLLQRIRKEKEQLVKDGKLKKKDLVTTPISDEEKPFEIPESWEWCRMGDALDVRDGTHDSPKYYSEGYPLVTSKNLKNGIIDYSSAQLIKEEDFIKINERSRVDNGDILYAMIGSIGNPVIVKKDRDFAIKNMALFKQVKNGMFMPFVYLYLVIAQYTMREYASGGVQSFVSLGYLRNYLIPLPPLAEQHRIVSKIEDLFAQIEPLAKALSTPM